MKSRVNFIVDAFPLSSMTQAGNDDTIAWYVLDAFPLSSMTQAGDAIELHTKQDIVLQGSESINGLKRELTRI